jgi:hypothetical protein
MMSSMKARVANGTLLLDVPTDRPDGQEVELLRLDAVLGRSRYWFALEADRKMLFESFGRSFDPQAGDLAWHDPIVPRSRGGRLIVSEPSQLADSEDIELVALDDVLATGGDWMDDEERGHLHAAIEEGIEDAKHGRLIDADEVLARLRAVRCGPPLGPGTCSRRRVAVIAFGHIFGMPWPWPAPRSLRRSPARWLAPKAAPPPAREPRPGRPCRG